MAGHQCVEGLPLLLPAQVAVHGEVATAHTRQLPNTDSPELLLKLLKVSKPAGGHGVAPVHKGVDEDARELLLRRQLQQRVQMPLMRMHAAVRDQPDQMQRAAFCLRRVHSGQQRGIGEEAAVRNRPVDAGDVHAHNAPGAEVQVTHFAVAHLPVGQARRNGRSRAAAYWETRAAGRHTRVCGQGRWRCRASQAGIPSHPGWSEQLVLAFGFKDTNKRSRYLNA